MADRGFFIVLGSRTLREQNSSSIHREK